MPAYFPLATSLLLSCFLAPSSSLSVVVVVVVVVLVMVVTSAPIIAAAVAMTVAKQPDPVGSQHSSPDGHHALSGYLVEAHQHAEYAARSYG